MESLGSTSSTPKRNSNDIGWEYGMLVDPSNPDRVKCKLCGKEMSGGTYRMKEHIGHITGNVSKCPKASEEDIKKCKDHIRQGKEKKMKKKRDDTEVRSLVNIDVPHGVDDLQGLGDLKPTHLLGLMDKFADSINPEISLGKKTRQQKFSDALFEDRTHSVHQLCARWLYEAGVPFNAINCDSFLLFCEGLGQFGPGWVPPSQYQLREPLLKENVRRTKEALKRYEEEWSLSGCSVMIDAWTDRKKRSIMNFCVNCKIGTCFMSSMDASNDSHISEYIFTYIDKCIEEVGAERVVQVVTDNDTNNMGAKKLLKEKRPNIFWSGCAGHVVDLMLEDISNIPRYKETIEESKALTVFLYAHTTILELMRSFTNVRDIVRPGITRFASCFLTLESLYEKRTQLKMMFDSPEWNASQHSKSEKGKKAYETVMSVRYWHRLISLYKVLLPLVRVLRMVKGDNKPSMGFVYGEILRAKESIKEAMDNLESNYQPIIRIIDEKYQDRLDTPLHLSAYLLNPFYFYKDPSIAFDHMVMDGFLSAVETFYHGEFGKQNDVVNIEFNKYKNKECAFGRALALKACEANDEKFDLAHWWGTYGCYTPNLQRMAMRILSLTSSSSGCERNWSIFEGVHTKMRNRLDTSPLNDLVFVQFNSKLINRKKQIVEKKIDVLLANDSTNAQSWVVENGENDGASGAHGVESSELNDVDSEDKDRDFVNIDCEVNEEFELTI